MILAASTVETIKTLSSKQARQEWEYLFNVSYIEPVLKNLDERMTVAMNLVARDYRQGECVELVPMLKSVTYHILGMLL